MTGHHNNACLHSVKYLLGNIFRITVFMRIGELILLPNASMTTFYLLVAVSLIPRLVSREIIRKCLAIAIPIL